jgi:hypothetical protein
VIYLQTIREGGDRGIGLLSVANQSLSGHKMMVEQTPASTLGNAGFFDGWLGLPITRLNLTNMQ